MRGLPNWPVVDPPIAAFVLLLGTTVAVYGGLQFAQDGEVDAVATATFGLAFAASLVGLSLLRRRFAG